jgi:short-subunit dehydrogenase
VNIAKSVILLTGASGGIGCATAGELARRGASLVLVGRGRSRLELLAERLRVSGTSVHVLAEDVAAAGAPARIVAGALELTGRIDALIHCAGVQSFGAFVDDPDAAAATLFNVNTVAAINLTHAALPHMLFANHGHIVFVGSIFGSIGFPFFATYSATKFALRGFSEALRRELAGTKLGVSYVAPRFTRTAFNSAPVVRMAQALKMNQDEPDVVARRVVVALEGRGRNHYLGWPEKIFVRVNSLLPRMVDQPLMRQVDRMRPFAAERSR